MTFPRVSFKTTATYPKLFLYLKGEKSKPDKKPRGPVFLKIPNGRQG